MAKLFVIGYLKIGRSAGSATVPTGNTINHYLPIRNFAINPFKGKIIERRMTKLNIRRLMSGGIITNYFCTSRCGHCLYNCSPKWAKQYIDADTSEKNLKTIGSLGCRSSHIGGGEPLLRPDDLGAVLRIAGELGISVEYVETNSSWFKDSTSAETFLVQTDYSGSDELKPEEFYLMK